MNSLTGPRARLTKRQCALTAVLGLGSLFIYYSTLCPTVAEGDSGEIIAASYTWGVLHPSGYPLYTLTSRLFSHLVPFGTFAEKINFYSAFLSSSTAILLFLIVVEWTKKDWAALLAAGLFCFCPLVWSYSVIAEVFPLNNFFVALLTLMALRFWKTRSLNLAFGMAFTMGLALSNHHMILFVALPTALWVLWIERERLLEPKTFISFSVFFFLGFLPYLYLPIAGKPLPMISWGHLNSFQGVWGHVFRSEYGVLELASSYLGQDTQFVRAYALYFKNVGEQTLYFGILLAGLGFVTSAIAERKTIGPSRLMFICFFFSLFVMHTLSRLSFDNPIFMDIRTRFWLQPNILVFVWLGVGASTLLGKWPFLEKRFIAPIAVSALILTQILFNYRSQDQSENFTFRNYARDLLDPVPENGMLLTRGELETNTVRYMQHCEDYRTDVRVLDRSMLTHSWYKPIIRKNYPSVMYPGRFYQPTHPEGFTFEEFFTENLKETRIFTTQFSSVSLFEKSDLGFLKKYKVVPYGMTFEVVPVDRDFTAAEFLQYASPALPKHDTNQLDRYRDHPWENLVFESYWRAFYFQANKSIELAVGDGENIDFPGLGKSIELFENLISNHPDPRPEYHLELGDAYFRMSAMDPELREKAKRSWRQYLKTADTGDRARRRVAQQLRSL